MDALTCPVCMEQYDMGTKRPKTLKCGHSLCLECLKEWAERKGRIECPIDNQVFWEELDTIPDNQSIKDMLMAMEVRCPKHSSELVEQFCIKHVRVHCSKCGHKPGEDCESRRIIDDNIEIVNLLLKAIDEKNRQIPATSMNPELRNAVEKRYKEKIQGNINLLQKLTDIADSLNGLKCWQCQQPADMLDKATFEGYCRQHASGTKTPTLIILAEKSEEALKIELRNEFKLILKNVNYSSLTREELEIFVGKQGLEVTMYQALGKSLLAKAKEMKADFSALPETTVCPKCMQDIRKSVKGIFALSCNSKLHAICQECAAQLMGQPTIECPLDGLSYQGGLQRMEAAQTYVPGPSMPPGFGPPVKAPMPASVVSPPHFGPPTSPPASGGMSQSQFLPNAGFPSPSPPAAGGMSQSQFLPNAGFPAELAALQRAPGLIPGMPPSGGPMSISRPPPNMPPQAVPANYPQQGPPLVPGYNPGAQPPHPGYQQGPPQAVPANYPQQGPPPIPGYNPGAQPPYPGYQQGPPQFSQMYAMPQPPQGPPGQYPPYQSGYPMPSQPYVGYPQQYPSGGGYNQPPPDQSQYGMPSKPSAAPVSAPPSNPVRYVAPPAVTPGGPNPAMPAGGQAVPGTPLPDIRLDPGKFSLTRFPSVLPQLGSTAANMQGNNKGWHVNFSRNQVDSVTIFTFDQRTLIGIGIANPIQPNAVAIVESVSLYNGQFATGNPVTVHQGGEQLVGGNLVITYVNFRSGFPIPAFTKMTLKVKIVAPPGQPLTGMDLYRGNPFDRPDIWIGSDDLIWEFEETIRVGEGEFVNGQNNLSGPILRFIYRQ